MSDTIVSNPPAFPNGAIFDVSGLAVEAQPGMSLRDWFAGQAMVAFHAHLGGTGNVLKVDDRDFAEDAAVFYRMADAMLAARQEPRP